MNESQRRNNVLKWQRCDQKCATIKKKGRFPMVSKIEICYHIFTLDVNYIVGDRGTVGRIITYVVSKNKNR